MASPALIEFATLLEPIPGDDPAGVPAPLTVRQKLDQARKDEEPHPDDPTQAPIPKKSDWSLIIKTATDLLQTKSKDLALAGRLTEALARQHGFAGLRDGLHLMGDLVEQCWDNDAALEKPRLHPAPDEGETMEVRAGPFHWLSDVDYGARFPNSVRTLPLLLLNGAPRSLLDYNLASDGKSELTRGDFDRAGPVSADTAEDLGQCTAELDRLDILLNDKFGPEAPSLMGLRQAVDECQRLFTNIVGKQPGGVPDGGTSTNGTQGTANAGAGMWPAGDFAASRAECYAQLSRIADMLESLEPHSPIPDLIRRAVELGKMPFRQLVRELIRDANQLAELRREFGIREAEGG